MPNLSSRMAPASKSKRGILGILRELFTYSDKLKAPMAVALLHSRTFTLRPRENHFIRYLTERLHKRYSG